MHHKQSLTYVTVNMYVSACVFLQKARDTNVALLPPVDALSKTGDFKEGKSITLLVEDILLISSVGMNPQYNLS